MQEAQNSLKNILLEPADAKRLAIFAGELNGNLKLIEKNSPLSVLCTFEIIKILRKKENLTIKDSLEYEYRFTYRAIECSDFIEGIRAQVIDKDRNPNWQHNHIRNVPREKVKMMLKPLN